MLMAVTAKKDCWENAAAIETDEFYRLCRVYVLQMRLIRLFTIKTFLKYIFELIFHTDQPAFSARH